MTLPSVWLAVEAQLSVPFNLVCMLEFFHSSALLQLEVEMFYSISSHCVYHNHGHFVLLSSQHLWIMKPKSCDLINRQPPTFLITCIIIHVSSNILVKDHRLPEFWREMCEDGDKELGPKQTDQHAAQKQIEILISSHISHHYQVVIHIKDCHFLPCVETLC